MIQIWVVVQWEGDGAVIVPFTRMPCVGEEIIIRTMPEGMSTKDDCFNKVGVVKSVLHFSHPGVAAVGTVTVEWRQAKIGVNIT